MAETFNLQLVPGGVPTVVHVSQYDTDRVWTFTPIYGSDPYKKTAGSSAFLEATKPDKTVVMGNVDYNDNGTITINLASVKQLTTVAGDVYGKVRIVNSKGDTLASGQIVFAVDVAGIEEEARMSKSDIALIESVSAEMETSKKAAADSATAAASSATKSADSATDSANSATASASSATASGKSATASQNSATASANSAAASESSATASNNSATASANSATEASGYATNASGSATTAKSWAVGPSAKETSGTDTTNAKYYAGKAAESQTAAANSATEATNAYNKIKGHMKYCGESTFANLPASGADEGDTYFVTDRWEAYFYNGSAFVPFSQMVQEQITVPANGWTGEKAPYVYDLGSNYANFSIMVDFDGARGTQTQYLAAASAAITGGDGTKIYAWGDIPTIDLPLILQYTPIIHVTRN